MRLIDVLDTPVPADVAADARRALSAHLPICTWPPKVGARIHYNSGWPHTSWTAEVRGIVDEVAVIRKYSNRRGHVYSIIDRLDLSVWAGSRDSLPPCRVGPLPKELRKQ